MEKIIATRRQVIKNAGAAALAAVIPYQSWAVTGSYKTLADFGWAVTDAPSVQTTKLQAALDSRYPILLPNYDPVTIDSTVYMRERTRLLGTGASTIVQTNGAADTLVLQESYCEVNRVFFAAPVGCTASAIVVGPKLDGDFAIYNDIIAPQFDGNHRFGIKAAKFGGLTVMRGMLRGREAAVFSQNAAVDTGDSKVLGCDINADATIGSGLWWTAGGGWLVSTNKFNVGNRHVKLESYSGNTGTINLENNSLEGNCTISVDMVGNTLFNRAVINGNNFGVLGVAVAVRNFNVTPGDGGANRWLKGLMVANNVFEAAHLPNYPIVDIGCAQDPIIGPNHYQGKSTGNTGVIIRPECHGAVVHQNGSKFVGLATAVQNLGVGTTII